MILDSSLNITLDDSNNAVFRILGEERFKITNAGPDISGRLQFSNGRYIHASVQDDPDVDELRFKASGNLDEPLRIYGGSNYNKRVGIGRLSESPSRPNEDMSKFGLDLQDTGNGYLYGLRLTNDSTGTGGTDGGGIYYDNNNMYIRNFESGPIKFKTKGAQAMVIASNGCIGIGGITDPKYTLQLGFLNSNSGGAQRHANWNYISYSDTKFRQHNGNFTNISIFVGGHISINGAIICVSDKRTKTNIHPMNPVKSLDNLRLLNPVHYYYKDSINNPSQLQAGFIAQETKHVLPTSLEMAGQSIPNILASASYYVDSFKNKIIQFSDFDTSKLELDNSGNFYPYLRVFDEENDIELPYWITISKILSSNSIQIETKEELPSRVFVYGQYVDNFHLLHYHRVFTTFVASMKEVDAELQKEKLKTLELQREMNELISLVQTIQK
jgi:hypothetical protein